MRSFIIIASMLAPVACTAPNPEFGETTGATEVSTSAMSATSTAVTTTPMTSSQEVTSDASMTSSVGETTLVSTTTDESSTGELDRHCCAAGDCSNRIRACLCEFPDELGCCDGEWGINCPGLAVACGGICMGEVRSCCVPSNLPACTGIVEEVSGFCLSNYQCCVAQWTPDCVVAYELLTGACGLQSCDAPHDTPGCEDPDIMNCVCEELQLPQCCEQQWHADCVEAAAAC